MHNYSWGNVCSALTVLVMALARDARAQAPADTVVLGLAEVQRLAIDRNPQLAAARQDTAIARAERRQARTYPFNPEVAALFPGIPQGGASLYELSISQEIEWAGQRGLRSGAADHGVARARATVNDATRRTLGEASIAYYRAVAAGARLALAQEAVVLSERLIAAVRVQIREGEISSLEANLAEIETGRARARVLSTRREATAAELTLKEAIGLEPGSAVRLRTDTTTPAVARVLPADSLIRVALARRPDLAARTAAVRQSEVQVALARREAIPNLRVGAVAERDSPGDAQRIGLAIGVGVPLLNRNRGITERRRAEATQARLMTVATELSIRTDVLTALRSYETAAAEATVYEASVLEPARRNVGLLEAAYRAGKYPITTLLLLRNQLLDAELNYWDAWFAAREAAVRLDVATAAMPLDTPPSPTPSRNEP